MILQFRKAMRTITRFLLVGAIILGGLVPGAEAGSLTSTFTTTPNGGQYAPRNIVAVWIEGPGGTFVKTIGRWAQTRKASLVGWNAKAGANDVDAVSGATRADHAAPLTVTWNLLDKAGAPVADGTYTIRMELADSNASTVGQNHQGTFTFVKGATGQTQTALTNGGFTNVSITYDPAAPTASCNNGVVDVGEKCDPGISGSCPVSCAASTDACAPNVLVGSATSCSAECMVQTITACTDGDGCCAPGCEATDSDCTGAAEDDAIVGGCAAGSGSGGLAGFALLGLLALVVRVPRKR